MVTDELFTQYGISEFLNFSCHMVFELVNTVFYVIQHICAVSAVTLLVGQQERHLACKIFFSSNSEKSTFRDWSNLKKYRKVRRLN